MKKLIEYFVDKSTVVNLFSFLVLVLGIYSAYTLQKDIFPQVEFDVILIRTDYPGSSSEDVEKLVTLSVERALKEVDGIKELNALSAEGSSIVYLTVDPDAKISKVLDDAKDAIDKINDFPDEVEDPKVSSLSNKNRRGVIKVAIKGAEYTRIREVSKKLRDELELNKKISLVDIDGYREDEIVALLDPKKLEDNEVTLTEIAAAIKKSNMNLSAGKIKAVEGDVYIRTLNEFNSVEDVENVVVRSNSEGKKVTVKDIAHVVQRPIENSVLGRSNGEEALFLDIKIKQSSDILETTDQIKETVHAFFENSDYKDIKYDLLDDASYYVSRRLNVLKENGIMGIFLVFGCLLLFLNFSTSVVTSLGAPMAFMTSFAIMQAFGMTIDLISMFGLILVLGMLVDDSIIVAEHFYQKLEAGIEPREAARQSAVETFKPVCGTIITTMIAFGALFFMGGIMGKFLWPVPATVMICLVASLFECFFILPAHLADFVRLKKEKQWRITWYKPVLVFYGKVLKKVLNAPAITVSFFIMLFLGSVFFAKTMNFELFPGDDVRTVFMQFKGRVGVDQSVTANEMLKVEKMLINEFPRNEVQQIQARVGLLAGEQGNKLGNHYGSIVIYLTDPVERERTTDDILNTALEKAQSLVSSEYQITVKKIQGGPPRGKPVEIDIKGESIADLKAVSHKIEDALKEVKGVTTTEIDFEEGNDQVIFKVKEDEARRLGLDVQTIAFELRRALAGDTITEIRRSDEDIDIKIKFDDRWIKDAAPLLDLSILNSSGRRIKLGSVVYLEKHPGAFVIRRLDRKRIFSVSASLDKAVTTPTRVAKEFAPKVKEITSEYEGVTFKFGGENEDTKESMGGLIKSFLIAFSLIFIVLVVMFNSVGNTLAVMSAIPLGMIGVIWSFKFFGMSLGFMAMMGVVGLVGVVVNDSIVLVECINEFRKKEPDLIRAIFKGCLSRLRAVILTTVTTVAGLLPVAHATGGDPFIKPMAMSFAWGLAFATAVTLIFVPCQYIVFEKLSNFFRKKEDKVAIGIAQELDVIERETEESILHTEVEA
ncbi:efflux RND transporter permease subunit [Bacteriovorax sp. Seq25_V]|uniref:efflux RND transporter permease subunit n=1 Tax=Bacteriovorax sp. Seq25_V TaxID=1201288 RepID=UPI00038A47CB|nr:efflux RND transporter permease subunit [Bacteriovorax sp. Seq25_V]EQC46869.1 export membrane protein [Bacteriovorax sp. Seq25_V]